MPAPSLSTSYGRGVRDYAARLSSMNSRCFLPCEAAFDATDLPRDTYLYGLETDSFRQVRRMVLLK